MPEAPFNVGEQVNAQQLKSWIYTGLSGKPGRDKKAVRRFKKGVWILEVRAHEDPARITRVVSIRTVADDDNHWRETRDRLMRNRRNS